MQINEFSMNGAIQKKLLERLNEISIYIHNILKSAQNNNWFF
jgi:hypothetical protein